MKSPGHLLLFGGSLAFLVISFLTWYEHSGQGYAVFNENAWAGEWSAVASCGAAAALVSGVLSLWKPGPLFRWLSLAGALTALIFSILYFKDNSEDIKLDWQVIPSGIHRGTVYAAIAAAAAASAGGVLVLLKTKRP